MSQTRIVVQFRPGHAPKYVANAEEQLDRENLRSWQELSRRFGGLTLTPRFSALSPSELEELEKAAKTTEATSLTRYFTVICPRNADVEALLGALRARTDIDAAYVDPTPTVAAVQPADDPLSPAQGYLNAAPTGIDAKFAWTVPGGDGAGQHLADVELGWTLDHEDLVGKGAKHFYGTILDSSRSHGTAVLGEICAVDNNLGCVGIAPNIATVSVASASGTSVADAILACTARFQGQGVAAIILIELQWVDYSGYQLMIVEAAPDVRDSIRLATKLGSLVVEAAGNGGHDLDSYQFGGKYELKRSSADFQESGALVVGAASSVLPHRRLSFSNHGSRIDCFGWGENVTTAYSDASGSKSMYTSGFNGTSSASPIIVGAALSVQGMKAAKDGVPFNPATLRAILSDVTLGTQSATPATDRIGVMPNLARIAGSVLNVAPELYIRDTIADTGLPHKGDSCTSPDIIMRQARVANPQAIYGEGSGTENKVDLSEAVTNTKDQYGYVRIRNRSKVAANAAVVQLYWAPPGVLVLPDQWRFIGSTVVNVPPDNKLTVAGPFIWPKASIPGPGHYCFVATVSHTYDLAPDLAHLGRIANFSEFIQANNNVAWRNFNVTAVQYSSETDSAILPFNAPNPEPGSYVDMAVEVVADLPKGSRLWIAMPDHIRPAAGLKASQGASPGTINVELRPKGITQPFDSQILPPENQMVLHAQVPRELWDRGPYEVFARQLYRSVEIGRITWVLKKL